MIGFGSGTKQVGPITGVNAVLSGVANASVTWANPDPGLYDSVQVERSINGGAYAVVYAPGKGTASFLDSPGNSLDAVYRVRAYRSGWTPSAYVGSPNVRTQPAPPSPQNLTTTNPGIVDFSFYGVGHGNVSTYYAYISTNNGASWSGPYAAPSGSYRWTGIAHGSIVRAAAATVDGFGQISTWAQWGSYVSVVNDTAGPPAVNVTIGSWDIAYAAYNLSWPAHYDANGNGTTYLQYNVNGGGWQTISGVSFPAGGAYSGKHGGFGRGVQVQFRVVATDVYGNQTIGPATANVWTRPLGGGIIYPQNSYTWGNVSGWGWMGNDRCVGGAMGGNENYGFWWYGTAIQDFCKTHTPDRMYFWCQKVSGLSAAGTAYIAVHDSAAFNPGAVPGVGGVFHAPSLAVDPSNEMFGAGWYPGFMNGQNKGAVVIGNGQPFKALYGKNENGSSGAFTIYFDQ